MAHIENNLEVLKKHLLKMLEMVKSQTEISREVVFGKSDDRKSMVKEIIANDKLVNAMELELDKQCENILALFNPVAIDLRFVLAALKINNNLEKIGDHAVSIARTALEFEKEFGTKLLDEFEIKEMFDASIEMIGSISVALKNNDTSLARQIFKQDDHLNQYYKKAFKTGVKALESEPKKAEAILNLIAIARKIERIGDLTKNLGMELIFHIEAKVLRHEKNG